MILIAAVVAAAAPSAAPAAAPAAVDPARLAAATQLVQLLDIKGDLAAQGNQTVQQMSQGLAIRAQLAQQPGFIPLYQAKHAQIDPILKKAGAIQAGIARQVFAQQSGAVVQGATRAYAQTYSLAELNGLIAFYKSPLGQAFRTKQGRVMGAIAQGSGQLIGRKIQEGMKAQEKQLQAALAPLNSIAAGK